MPLLPILQLAVAAALCALSPPLAVFLATGASPSLVTLFLLTALFWFPGVAHAGWIVWGSLLQGGG